MDKSTRSVLEVNTMPGQIVPQLVHKDAPYIFRLIKENRLQDLMELLDSRKGRIRVMRIKDFR